MKRLLVILFLFTGIKVYAQHVILLPVDSIDTNNGLSIIFPVNKTEFYPNQPSLSELDSILTNLLSSKKYRLSAIHLYGAASPEGPYDNNVRLAKSRTDRILNYLSNKHGDLPIYSWYIPEDYDKLFKQIQKDSIYFEFSNIEDKRLLKSKLQQNKELWNYLLDVYYPNLRAVNIVILIVERLIPIEKIEYNPTIELSYKSKLYIQYRRHIEYIKSPMFRLKTNLIYDSFLVPNLSIEYLPKTGHLTSELRFLRSSFRNDNIDKTWIIHGFEGGFRYYCKEKFLDWYFGINIGFDRYDIQLNDITAILSKKYLYNTKYEITFGYIYNLGRGWSIDANLGLGYMQSRYNKYHNAEEWATFGQWYYNWHNSPEDFIPYNNLFRWIGPINIGVSISYDILHYRCVKQ